MKTIIVEVLGGVATVINGETGCVVEVHDYDVDGVEEENLTIDEGGKAYVLVEYQPDNPLPETHVELQNEIVRQAIDKASLYIEEGTPDTTEDKFETVQALRSAALIMKGRKNVEG